MLTEYTWPGNVRELDNAIARVTLRAAAAVPRGRPVVLTGEMLGSEFAPAAPGQRAAAGIGEEVTAQPGPLRDAVDEYQRTLIRRTVQEKGGNWAAAARRLGLYRSNLHRLAKRLGLDVEAS